MEARFLRFALAAFLLTFASTQEQASDLVVFPSTCITHVLLLSCCLQDVDPIPVPRGNYAFFEPFASRQDFDNRSGLTTNRVSKPRAHVVLEFRWVLSAAKKEGAEEEVAKYDGEILVTPIVLYV